MSLTSRDFDLAEKVSVELRVKKLSSSTSIYLTIGAEMQQRLQISPQALITALKRKRIFALKGAAGKYHYPAFFADSAYDRVTLERVCQALGDLPGSSKLLFFTSPRYSLGGLSPLQALAKGCVEMVLDQANAFREA